MWMNQEKFEYTSASKHRIMFEESKEGIDTNMVSAARSEKR